MTPLNFKKLLETYAEAAFKKDEAALLAIYDKDVLTFDMWEHWSLQGIDAMRTLVRGWFASTGEDRDRVSFELIRTVEGADLAMAEAIVTYAAVNSAGEVLRSMQNRLTWVAAPKNGQWLIIHQHTSSPIDPNTTGVIFNR